MVLKLISEGKSIVIAPKNGKRTIAKADNVFNYIDSDFTTWGTDVEGKSTSETPVSIYEMKKDANFSQMFNLISKNLEKLRLGQDQIISFVEEHKDWLHPEGWATLFLFKENDKFFVALVSTDSVGEPGVDICYFEDKNVCPANDHLRVVVPQLSS